MKSKNVMRTVSGPFYRMETSVGQSLTGQSWVGLCYASLKLLERELPVVVSVAAA
jgi:hypothetical protein